MSEREREREREREKERERERKKKRERIVEALFVLLLVEFLLSPWHRSSVQTCFNLS